MPTPPMPEPLPDAPGIYFVWRDDRVVYVGQSQRLSSRCQIGNHGVIKTGDGLSWLLFDVKQLVFAECFYIGILRPAYNEIGRASCRVRVSVFAGRGAQQVITIETHCDR